MPGLPLIRPAVVEAWHGYNAPIAPAFRSWFRPVKPNRAVNTPIRHCDCGLTFIQQRGRVSRCPTCSAENFRALGNRWRRANPDKLKQCPKIRRASKLRRKYGLEPAGYDAMLLAQGGVCAICGLADRTGRRLAVDHCHKTGRIRGLLCAMCNTAIGKLGDDANRLRIAAAYLEAP